MFHCVQTDHLKDKTSLLFSALDRISRAGTGLTICQLNKLHPRGEKCPGIRQSNHTLVALDEVV